MCCGHNFGPVGGGKGGGHRGDGHSGGGVVPIGGDIAKRHKDESAVLQAGMWQDQAIRCQAALVIGGQVAPVAVGGRVGQQRLAIGDEVKVKRSHPPARFALAAIGGFDVVKKRKNLFRAKGGRQGGGNCGIHIIGTSPCWKAGCGIYPAGHKRAEMGAECITGETQGIGGRLPINREVRAEGDEQSLVAVCHRVTLSYS